MTQSDNEYSLKITKGILTSLDYFEKDTTDTLRTRIENLTSRGVDAMGTSSTLAGIGKTMILTPTDIDIHFVTFLTLKKNGEDIPGVHLATAKRSTDKKVQLDDPIYSMVVDIESFNHGMLHKHPFQISVELKKIISGVETSTTGKPNAVKDAQMAAATEKLQQTLREFGHSDSPPIKYNA